MVDLDIALDRLHQLQHEGGDLGAAYWLSVADLLKQNQQTQIEAQRFAACRHQARHMQEDGGEAAFVKAIDEYRKKNGI